MRLEWLLEHHKTESGYWWFKNKRRIVRDCLQRYALEKGTLLEIGCGGGYFSAQLQSLGWKVIASDLHPEGARFAVEQGAAYGLPYNADHGWPLKDNSIDAFVMLDVLEHLDLHVEVLKEAHRVLKPGGIGVIAVPAYQWLFSAWDEYNQHYRRYNRALLAGTAQCAGLDVLDLNYWNAISMPPAIFLRLRDRFRKTQLDGVEYPPVPDFVNSLLTCYGRCEAAWIDKGLPVPFGLSVLAVVRKPE